LVGFSDILTIVVPVFVVIAVGYCTGRMHLFDGERPRRCATSPCNWPCRQCCSSAS
jgi:hypothetical protein